MYDSEAIRNDYRAVISALSWEASGAIFVAIAAAGGWSYFYGDTLADGPKALAGGFYALGVLAIHQVYQLRLDGLRREMHRLLLERQNR